MLKDQQIGGVITWIPAWLVYIVVGVWLLAAWIRDSDRRRSLAGMRVVSRTL